MDSNKKDFYIDEIKVLEWLDKNPIEQVIRFRDRIEYRSEGKLHRVDGPAIEFTDGRKLYYEHGEKITFEEFTNNKRSYYIKKMKEDGTKQVQGDL
jgi:hypothetical protein